jgi:hypothetical protein
MSNNKGKDSTGTLTETFFSKLKEQSFTIILMFCMLVYQNKMFSDAKENYEKTINEKEKIIDDLYDEERQRFITREQYLMQQRDYYVDDLLRNNKK